MRSQRLHTIYHLCKIRIHKLLQHSTIRVLLLVANKRMAWGEGYMYYNIEITMARYHVIT